MILRVVGFRVDWNGNGDQSNAHAVMLVRGVHPGISMGSASASDEEKHSTSASSDSEEATNAPSAVRSEGERYERT